MKWTELKFCMVLFPNGNINLDIYIEKQGFWPTNSIAQTGFASSRTFTPITHQIQFWAKSMELLSYHSILT